MKFTLFAAAFTVAAAAPLAGQTPAPAAPRRPVPAAPRQARPARTVPDSQGRFDTIRQKYQKELDADRAALQRTRDRMREELTAAGWRPHRRFNAPMRARAARFGPRRAPRPRMMMRGAMLPRGGRGDAMMGRGGMRGAMPGRGMGPGRMTPGMPRPPRPDSGDAR